MRSLNRIVGLVAGAVVVVEGVPPEAAPDAWTVLRELRGAVSGPADWASEADHYLYGTPKRHPRDP